MEVRVGLLWSANDDRDRDHDHSDSSICERMRSNHLCTNRQAAILLISPMPFLLIKLELDALSDWLDC